MPMADGRQLATAEKPPTGDDLEGFASGARDPLVRLETHLDVLVNTASSDTPFKGHLDCPASAGFVQCLEQYVVTVVGLA